MNTSMSQWEMFLKAFLKMSSDCSEASPFLASSLLKLKKKCKAKVGDEASYSYTLLKKCSMADFFSKRNWSASNSSLDWLMSLTLPLIGATSRPSSLLSSRETSCSPEPAADTLALEIVLLIYYRGAGFPLD